MANKVIKSIAVMTSGGDSPGMNCAIRAVVRTGIGAGLSVFGIKRGFTGLLEKDIYPMDVKDVGNILQRGGTILQTSRCKDFFKKEARQKAAKILRQKNIDALIVIGGNGSFKAAYSLYEEFQIPVIGIPGTIDNDISGTDYTIGFDTAVQTAIEAVDKIRDTASSHARTFIIEVMGRKSPMIANHVAICTGAENIVINSKINAEDIAKDIKRGLARGKNSSIIIAAEGKKPGIAYSIRDQLKNDFDIHSQVCVLGHIQRGGNPSSTDRFLASQMGYCAVKTALQGSFPSAISFSAGTIKAMSMSGALTEKQVNETQYLELLKALSI